VTKKHKIRVYGTLRPGNTPVELVPGFLYDLGWYPGAALKAPGCNSFITCEVIEATDAELERLDYYEGYSKDDEANSLYLRVPYLDGWIYVYNHDLSNHRLIEGGDWLKHKDMDAGTAAGHFVPDATSDVLEDQGVA